MNNRNERSPLDALLSPDARLRKEAKAALRYVLDPLSDAQLRTFQELSVLLQRWKPGQSVATALVAGSAEEARK